MKPAPLNEILKEVIRLLNATKSVNARVYTDVGEEIARPYFRIDRIDPVPHEDNRFPNYLTYITVNVFSDDIVQRNDMVNDVIRIAGPIEIEGRKARDARLYGAVDTFTDTTTQDEVFRAAVTLEIATTDEYTV